MSCWEWEGSRDVYGYGRFKRNGRSFKAHRVVYEFVHSVKLRPAEHICHRCDNPGCVNPEHLFVGNTAANMKDRHQKGRDARGSRHGMSKLNEIDVERIRDIHRVGGHSNREIARYFGISSTQINNIVSRKQWVNA